MILNLTNNHIIVVFTLFYIIKVFDIKLSDCHEIIIDTKLTKLRIYYIYTKIIDPC